MKIDVTLENGLLPDKYAKFSDITIDGVPSVSFPIRIGGVPDGAKSLAVMFVDFDSLPVCGFAWTHWTAANIPADISEIPENASQDQAFGMVQGKNHFSGAVSCRYGGPTPPDKTHNYTLTVFALDCELELDEGFGLVELLEKAHDHVLEKSELILPARSN